MPSAQHYAKLHRKHLELTDPQRYRKLLASGELNSTTSSVGQEAEATYLNLLSQWGNHPDLKNLPFQEQETQLQSHPEAADELVRHQLVQPPPMDRPLD
jgi:hypothetical protein